MGLTQGESEAGRGNARSAPRVTSHATRPGTIFSPFSGSNFSKWFVEWAEAGFRSKLGNLVSPELFGFSKRSK